MPDRPRDPADDTLPRGIGRAATAALALVGISRLSQLTTRTERELLALHGVGPKAIRILRDALATSGRGFAER